MEKWQFVEQMKTMLVKELESLKENWNVEGIRSLHQIEQDIECSMFSNSVTIVSNKRFELTFKINENEIEFSTTYSNQIIDQTYMNEMMVLNQSKGAIEGFLKTIVQYSKEEN